MLLGDIQPPCGSQPTETLLPKVLLFPGNLMLGEGECRSLVPTRGGFITREDISNSCNGLSDHLERQDRVTIMRDQWQARPHLSGSIQQHRALTLYTNLSIRTSGMDCRFHFILFIFSSSQCGHDEQISFLCFSLGPICLIGLSAWALTPELRWQFSSWSADVSSHD